MKYKHEVGVILDQHQNILQIVDGEIAHVTFPAADILKYHKDNPGFIYALAHTHPPMSPYLSRRDHNLLKGFAHAISPYPMRMIVGSQDEPNSKKFRFTLYFAQLESIEAWEERGKEGPRKYEVIGEDTWVTDMDGFLPEWIRLLVERSYEK